MKRILPLLPFAFFGCTGNGTPGTAGTTVPDTLPSTYYPYSPRHDVDFNSGNPENARVVLEIWKGFESGNLKEYAKYFADTAILVFHDGVIQGPKDAVLEQFKQRRDKFPSLQCHIDYWQPVRVAGPGQEWVLLWGQLDGIKGDKTTEARALHQVWKFNRAGQIYFMQEYTSIFWW